MEDARGNDELIMMDGLGSKWLAGTNRQNRQNRSNLQLTPPLLNTNLAPEAQQRKL